MRTTDMYDLSITLNFLSSLAKNNNRDWFNEHKDQYQNALKQVTSFAQAVLDELNADDVIETASGKKSLHRIYRDVRFSKDKTPYNTHFSGGYKRASAQRRGGFYFRIKPNEIFVAGGFWGPNSDDLKHIRNQIAQEPELFREIISNQEFKSYFREIKGEKLKTAPKGFDKDHPAIDILRYKQFLLTHQFDDKEAIKPDFHLTIVDGYRRMRPFFDYMSEILTTDLNGAPLNEGY